MMPAAREGGGGRGEGATEPAVDHNLLCSHVIVHMTALIEQLKTGNTE